MTNGDFVSGVVSQEKLKQIVREIRSIHQLTIKVYSNLSNINKPYFSKFRIPIKHRQFSRKIFQNPEYKKLMAMIHLFLFILHVVTGFQTTKHTKNWM